MRTEREGGRGAAPALPWPRRDKAGRGAFETPPLTLLLRLPPDTPLLCFALLCFALPPSVHSLRSLSCSFSPLHPLPAPADSQHQNCPLRLLIAASDPAPPRLPAAHHAQPALREGMLPCLRSWGTHRATAQTSPDSLLSRHPN